MANTPGLTRRERQIMDILYRRGQATAADVQADLADPPSYSAVRAHLRILEEKGYVSHVQDGPRYLFAPTTAPDKAKRSALRHLLHTFFDNSPAQAMAALLDASGDDISNDDLDQLSQLIEQARKEGR